MLRSMTGFGAAAGEARAGAALRVEVRSVNHRHLALKTRLPEALFALEGEVEGRVRAACERGAITVHVTAERAGSAGGARLDRELVRRYRDELAALAGELGLEQELSLDALVALPGVFAEGAEDAGADELGPGTLALLDQALGQMVAMREREGAALEADLRKHARALAALAARIEERMPLVVSANQGNLTRRLEALLGGRTPVAPEDLAREIALLADRLDVSEELARLRSHLAQLDGLLAGGGRIGRQLDFLVQEILREVNTIGSKCSDATVAHWVVEAKTLVERLREQVQNVE
jgi:uncharacterized protein (TIGR00255 family)